MFVVVVVLEALAYAEVHVLTCLGTSFAYDICLLAVAVSALVFTASPGWHVAEG